MKKKEKPFKKSIWLCLNFLLVFSCASKKAFTPLKNCFEKPTLNINERHNYHQGVIEFGQFLNKLKFKYENKILTSERAQITLYQFDLPMFIVHVFGSSLEIFDVNNNVLYQGLTSEFSLRLLNVKLNAKQLIELMSEVYFPKTSPLEVKWCSGKTARVLTEYGDVKFAFDQNCQVKHIKNLFAKGIKVQYTHDALGLQSIWAQKGSKTIKLSIRSKMKVFDLSVDEFRLKQDVRLRPLSDLQ